MKKYILLRKIIKPELFMIRLKNVIRLKLLDIDFRYI